MSLLLELQKIILKAKFFIDKYFQQPQIRLKHTLALAGRSPLVYIDYHILMWALEEKMTVIDSPVISDRFI